MLSTNCQRKVLPCVPMYMLLQVIRLSLSWISTLLQTTFLINHTNNKLEHLVLNMAEQQATLIAAVSSLSFHPATPLSPCNPKLHNLHCFYCHEEGHIACNCWRHRIVNRCQICSGSGQSPENCAATDSMNNSNPHQQKRKSQHSINFQRVPY